jgi:hypothetical protein
MPSAVTRPIYLTDEYAIKALMPICRRHSAPAMQIPQRLKTITAIFIEALLEGSVTTDETAHNFQA